MGAIGSFGGNLSWFSKKKRINIGSLVYDTPNAGTVIGDDYYYARSPGKDEKNCGIYFVEDIAGEPRFETTSNLCISKSVYRGSVLDFVAANEDDADRYGTSSTYVDDCWNTGTNTDDHKECKDAPAATLTWMGASAVTNYNDGMNCPVTMVVGSA